jgi:hypothetical protein
MPKLPPVQGGAGWIERRRPLPEPGYKEAPVKVGTSRSHRGPQVCGETRASTPT